MERAALGSSAERDSLAAAPDSLEPALRMYEGETVYDYAWFPAMQALDPQSCVFASTSRASRSIMRDSQLAKVFVPHCWIWNAEAITDATSRLHISLSNKSPNEGA